MFTVGRFSGFITDHMFGITMDISVDNKVRKLLKC